MQTQSKQTLAKQRWWDYVGLSILVMTAVLSPLIHGPGWDFEVAYREDTLQGLYGRNTWNPYPFYGFFWLFAILPVHVGALLWSLVNLAGFLAALRIFQGSYFHFACSLPAFWTFYGGQIEGLITLGLVVAWAAPAWAAGIGIVLLSFKPQIGLFAILFILYKRLDWRLLVVPACVYGLSLFTWGWWLPDWLASFPDFLSDEPANISLYPWSLILVWIPLIWQDLRIWLIVQSLVMPYYAYYSLAPLFTMQGMPLLWLNIASWLIFLQPQYPGLMMSLVFVIIIVISFIRLPKTGSVRSFFKP